MTQKAGGADGSRLLPADSIKDLPGEGGLTYRIPVRELPTLDFHHSNKQATLNTLDSCLNLVDEESVPTLESERKFWRRLRTQHYGAAATSYISGGLLMCLLWRSWVPRFVKDPALWRGYGGATCFIGGGGFGMWFQDVWEIGTPYHRWLCTALQRRTPMGDAARATYDRELLKDEGTKGFLAGMAEVWDVQRRAREWLTDESNPLSPRTWARAGPH
eukprot:TRINITY_DN55701_c0_g1_i1.p2 TRINITY_DN55701_c0_g1~~TRINITY_DN55701_c0_g1_i1.p2  ORF type:complete len:240 (+),score=67.16 TRINITY_DN55701_c0_g1_i1:71-721(+)